MHSYIWWLATSSVVGIGCYYTYGYVKKKLANHIVSKVKQELDNNMDDLEVTFQPIRKTKSALVVFTHGGKQHRVSVPYDRSKGRTMTRKQVWLVSGDTRTNITHKPGIPYLMTAEELGGEKIVVEKDNKVVREYGLEDTPNYLE